MSIRPWKGGIELSSYERCAAAMIHGAIRRGDVPFDDLSLVDPVFLLKGGS